MADEQIRVVISGTAAQLRDALKGAGYAVLEAPDGRTALALESSSSDPSPIPVGQTGFTGYLARPAEPWRLLDTVHTYLRPRRVAGEQLGQGRHILVVNDDPLQRKLLKVQLERAGFHISTAEDGQAARTVDAACALLLPGSDGIWQRIAATGEQAPARANGNQEGGGTPPTVTATEHEVIAQAIGSREPVALDTGPAIGGDDADIGGAGSQLGVLAFRAAAPAAFGPSEIALAHLLAVYAAQALGRAELLEEIRRQNAALALANRQLVAINQELQAFSYSVSHDLRAPLRSIAGFSRLVLEDYGDRLDEQGKEYLNDLIDAGRDMDHLIEALLHLSRVTRAEMRREPVDLSALAREVVAALAKREPEREVAVAIADGLIAQGDEPLLRIALENLLGNAWKFTRRVPGARIEVMAEADGGQQTYVVRDNGAGFNLQYGVRAPPFQPLPPPAQRAGVRGHGDRPGHGAAHRASPRRPDLGRR